MAPARREPFTSPIRMFAALTPLRTDPPLPSVTVPPFTAGANSNVVVVTVPEPAKASVAADTETVWPEATEPLVSIAMPPGALSLSNTLPPGDVTPPDTFIEPVAAMLTPLAPLIGPFTASTVPSFNKKLAALKLPSVAIWFAVADAPDKIADAAAEPVSVAATTVTDSAIVPAEFNASTLVARIVPFRVSPPFAVVRARVLALPVSLTAPATTSP